MNDWERLKRECPEVPKVIGRYTLGDSPRFLSRRAVPMLFMAIWVFVLALTWWRAIARLLS